MAELTETAYISEDSSEDDDSGSFQNEYDNNRTSFSDYEAKRPSLSLSDFENNRLSFSEHDNPLSDQESNKDFTEFLDHNQPQSESNSEEESKSYIESSAPKKKTETVTFYKYGQPTKVIHKTPPATYSKSNSNHSSKRSMSCSDSEDQDEMPAKRSKFDDLARPAKPELQNLDKAKAMMEKMGYKEGRGLGKHAQGRVDPVELSKQRGRRGLGLRLPGLEPEDLTWDSSMEVIQVEEVPSWLECEHERALDMNTLQSWKERGPRNHNIEEYSDFCDPSLLENILMKKSVFDSLDGDEMRKARTRCNPFETIGKGIFLNRAAMKMANMDRVFDFMFTSPKTREGNPMVRKEELLYFADVCAGPGGFSEYVLWRNKWRAKGFGFTLKGENDFKLSEFFAGPCESFEPFYGVKDDGNVFDPANIESLMHYVMDHTQQMGVHFMMADGGFSVDGKENIQELLSKQLYLCQFLVALCIVREGGHFVCKLFDIFSPFSVGLVYLMYRAFHQVSIHKPNSSRPANSERYIICKWKRNDCEPTREYLFNLNRELCQLGSDSKEDINYCVSMEVLTNETTFFEYIVKSNNELGERQVVNLIKISAFCRDVKLTELKQAEMRHSCLVYWKVPETSRKVDKTTPDELSNKRLKNMKTDFLTAKAEELRTEEHLEKHFKSVFDWLCVPIVNPKEIFFYVGLGRNKVYRLAQGGHYWKKVDCNNLELSPGTMVYGEMVQEFQGESKSQLKKYAFHIIDAISLGEEDVSQSHYTERLKMCKLYSEALNKSTRTDLCRLRVKIVFYLEDINGLFKGLTVYSMKGGNQELLLRNTTDLTAFLPKGVMFFNATKEPWTRHLSKKTKFKYYARPGGVESKFDQDRPPEACASVMECIEKRCVWLWEEGVGIHREPAKENVLHKDQLIHFINSKLSRR